MVAFTTEFASPRKSCSPKTPIRNQVQLPGLRYYNPEMGRWINRDPLAKLDYVDAHLLTGTDRLAQDPAYVFVRNDAIASFDARGLATQKYRYSSRCDCKQEDIMKGGCAAAKKAFDIGTPVGREGCGRLCCNGTTGEVTHTGPVGGRTVRERVYIEGHGWVWQKKKMCNPSWSRTCADQYGKDYRQVGAYHSHPPDAGEDFSDPDKQAGSGQPFFLWGTGGCKVVDPEWEHRPGHGDFPTDTIFVCDVNPDTGEVSNCRREKVPKESGDD